MNPLEFITQNQTLVTFLLSSLGAFITRLVEKGRLRRKHKEQLLELERQMEILQNENEALENKQLQTTNKYKNGKIRYHSTDRWHKKML